MSSEVVPNRVAMDDPHAIQYERTKGYESADTLRCKMAARVCIAGAGGGGALVAEALAKEGYLDIRVADPDIISEANANRLFMATPETTGRNKAELVAERIQAANHAARVAIFSEGVTADNIEDFFLAGSKKQQTIIAIDEIDVLRPDIALGFNQAARRFGIPVTTATDIGFGGLVTSYNPAARRYTYERVNHTPNDMHPFEKYEGDVALSSLAYIPTYGSIDTLLSVMKGADMPSSLRSVLTATAMLLDETERIVMQGQRGFRKPTWAPKQRWMDSGIAGSTHFPRASHYSHLVRAAIRDKVLHVNPGAEYRPEDIYARATYRQAHGESE